MARSVLHLWSIKFFLSSSRALSAAQGSQGLGHRAQGSQGLGHRDNFAQNRREQPSPPPQTAALMAAAAAPHGDSGFRGWTNFKAFSFLWNVFCLDAERLYNLPLVSLCLHVDLFLCGQPTNKRIGRVLRSYTSNMCSIIVGTESDHFGT